MSLMTGHEQPVSLLVQRRDRIQLRTLDRPYRDRLEGLAIDDRDLIQRPCVRKQPGTVCFYGHSFDLVSRDLDVGDLTFRRRVEYGDVRVLVPCLVSTVHRKDMTVRGTLRNGIRIDPDRERLHERISLRVIDAQGSGTVGDIEPPEIFP